MAYTQLSLVNSRMYNDYIDRTESRLDKAKAAVEKALELRPDLPEAHLSLAYYCYWGLHEYDQALRELAIAASR